MVGGFALVTSSLFSSTTNKMYSVFTFYNVIYEATYMDINLDPADCDDTGVNPSHTYIYP